MSVIMLRLDEGNGEKSGVTLQTLTNEGWVRFDSSISKDLNYELDTNQLNEVIYQGAKLSAMAGQIPTSGPLFLRMETESFKNYKVEYQNKLRLIQERNNQN